MQDSSVQDIQTTYLIPLKSQALLGVEGPDANKFLQGQLTCDLRELAPNHSLQRAQCSLKGRMMNTFRLLQDREDRVILRTFAELTSATQAALGKYIVFSKAEINNLSDAYTLVGLVGPEAEALLSTHLGAAPEAEGNWLERNGHLIIKLAEQRYECWLNQNTASAVLAEWAEMCQTGDENLWTLLDIRAGWAQVRPQTQELFTPQAVNYPLVGAVSFRKGCYTGQEVVARLHYKGKLKRRMYRVESSWLEQQALPPAPGRFSPQAFRYRVVGAVSFRKVCETVQEVVARLHYKGKLKRRMYRVEFSWPEQQALPTPGDDLVAVDGQPLGECVLSAWNERGSVEALLVMNDALAAQEVIDYNDGQMRLLSLPYAIPKDDDQPSLSQNQDP